MELLIIASYCDDRDAPEEPRSVLALLTCGHYSDEMSVASSSFDFPEDAHFCPTCRTERQFHIELQLELMKAAEA